MNRRIYIALMTLSLLIGLALWGAGRTAAATGGATVAAPATPLTTITVTNTDDGGAGSLRQAIADAAPGDTITFDIPAGDPGCAGGVCTITLTSGELLIRKNLTIQGPGAKLLTISGNNASRVFNIGISVTVNLSGLTVADGNGQGAAINNNFGGGILVISSTLNIDHCAIINNQSLTGVSNGGGIHAGSSSTLTMTNSTVSGNTAGFGGGLSINNSTASLTNCTITGNTSSTGAGILGFGSLTATLTLTNCTMAGNNGSGVLLHNNGAPATAQLKNTLVANNAPNFVKSGAVTLTSLGHNLDTDGSSGFSDGANGDLVGAGGAPIDARLAPLADHGGQTRTHALLNDSPAIEAGDNADAPPTDQRGLPRTGTVDIGAFEAVIALTPTALPTGTPGVSYPAQSFSAGGGAAPYTFALTGALPAGLTFAGATLSGTPTETGLFDFTVTATDSQGFAGVSRYSLRIDCQTITINPTTPTLPSGTAGTSYSQTFTQTGGTGATTFSTSAGSLPPGLTLSAGGVLSGTPPQAGTFDFTVTATDANNCAGSQAYSVTISCPTITVNPQTLPNGTVSSPYSQTVSASGASGPVTFAVTSGTLSPGLTLDSSTGALTGTPTAAGTFNFTVTATDANNCASSQVYSVTISCPTITVNPATLTGGGVGQPYPATTLTASGSAAPYSFAVTGGALPPGLTLSSGGALAGTPSAGGTFTFAVTATDGNGCAGSRTYTLAINAPPTIAGATIARQQGAPGTVSTVATVGDPESAAGSLAVSVTSVPTGLTVTNLVNAGGNVTATVAAACSATVGNNVIGLRVTDGGGLVATASLIVNVTASNAPQLTLKPSISLWPPNHKYRTVTLSQMVQSAGDDCDGNLLGSVVIERVTSDEPEDAPGDSDGNTTQDIVISADCQSVQLRSERDETKNGRVYTVTLRVRDSSGNVTRADYKVSVPPNQSGAPAVTDAAAYTVNGSCP